jgi:hypothetical protein
VNLADNWLHLVLSVVMIGLGVGLFRSAETSSTATDSGGQTPGILN